MSEVAIRSEQVRILYQQGPSLLLANVVNAAVVAGVLWLEAPSSALLIWVGAMALANGLRLVLRRSYLRAKPPPEAAELWGRRFVIGAVTTGALWGLAAFAFYEPDHILSQAILTFAIAGSTGAAAGTQACYIPAFLGYFLPTLTPFVLRLLLVGDGLHTGFAAMVAVYALVLVLVARSTHRTLRESLRLRFENRGLLTQLSATRAELESANTVLEERVRQRTQELEKREAALRAAQPMEAVGRLAAGVAHDFNNLLTVVTANAGDLLQRSATSAEQRAALEDVLAASDRGADLVRQLLAFARQQRLEPRIFDLNRLVRDDERLLARLIGEHIRLSFVLGDEALWISADPTQMRQVLVNLVTNARDAMPEGGELTVRVDQVDVAEHATLRPGAHARLSVEDTGRGLDAETTRRIFEPFFSVKAAGHGSGLGLATVKGIVLQSGGAAEVESTPEAGTIFRVYLPRVEHAAESAESSVPAEPAEVPKMTLLLAEDEPKVRSVMLRILSRLGHDVLVAEDGAQALEIARAHMGPIALLVTDVVMPRLTGPALFDALKPEREDLRVLFVSGYVAGEALPATKLSEGVAYLPKPFSPQDLRDKVTELLSGRPPPNSGLGVDASQRELMRAGLSED
jgi:signal transduction histidine kinase/ActR/RegA family two-component response regulator